LDRYLGESVDVRMFLVHLNMETRRALTDPVDHGVETFDFDRPLHGFRAARD
jgi:hypothetical protein